MVIINKDDSNTSVITKPVNFPSLPPHILEKIINEERKSASNDICGYEQFDIAMKMLNGDLNDNVLMEGFDWLAQSIQYNCQDASEYIIQKVHQMETTQNLTLFDFKWIKYAVFHNFEPAVRMVQYYAQDLNWNPVLSFGIYLIGNKLVPQNIEFAVTVLNTLVDSGNPSGNVMLNNIFFTWTFGDFNELYFLGAMIYFTGNEKRRRDYLYGIKLFKKAVGKNSIAAQSFINNLRNTNEENSSRQLLLGLILINSEDARDHDLGNKILEYAFNNLKKHENDDNDNINYELALCYENGFGCGIDIYAARNMYRKLVKAGWESYTSKYKELQEQIKIHRNNNIKIIIILVIFILAIVAISSNLEL